MSDKHREIAFYTFDSEDEALRAIQGLKAAGFDDETIKVAATTRKLAEQVAERGGVAAAEEWTVSDPEPDGDGQFKVIVEA